MLSVLQYLQLHFYRATIVFHEINNSVTSSHDCISSNQQLYFFKSREKGRATCCSTVSLVVHMHMQCLHFYNNANNCIPWKQKLYSLKTTIVLLENKDTGRELSNICYYFASAMLSFLQCQQFHSLKWRTMIKRIVCIDVVFGNWLKQSQRWNFETGVDFKVHSLLHGSNPITSMQTFCTYSCAIW